MSNYLYSRLNTLGTFLIIIICYQALDKAFYMAYDALSMKGDLWLTADWVINYSSGFIRRGLLGQILLTFCQLFNLDLIRVTIHFQLILIILFITLSIILYFTTTKTFIEKTIFCSPAFYISFCYWSPLGGFRKELLLLFFFILLIFLALSLKKQLATYYYMVFTVLLYIVLGLTHEMIIFFSPFFLFFFFILLKNKSISLNSFWCFFTIICLANILLLLLSYFFHGSPKSSITVCKSVSPYTISVFCNGAIKALGNDLHTAYESISYYIKKTNYLTFYPLLFLISFLPFTMIAYDKALKVKYFLLISLICLLPLFIIAIDWGRWISIYITLFSLLTFYLLHTNHAQIKPFYQQHILLFAILFVTYTLTWIIPYCCIYSFPQNRLIIKIMALL